MTTDSQRPDRPGRAAIFLGHMTLERLLDLPDGLRIVAVNHDFQRLGIPRELSSTFGVETTVDDDGKTWCRWNWGRSGGTVE